jgi:hypothetical protein
MPNKGLNSTTSWNGRVSNPPLHESLHGLGFLVAYLLKGWLVYWSDTLPETEVSVGEGFKPSRSKVLQI